MRRLLVSLAFGLAATAVTAQPGLMRGAGTMSCGTYAADRANGNPALTFQYFAFAQGYMSAHNQYMPTRQLRDVPTSDTILLYLDRYCRANPLDLVTNGIDVMMRDLGGPEYAWMKTRR